MIDHTGYGQYCPLSMAVDIIGNRWTILILRQLLIGSTGFNQIRRGVPLISRTLLAQRLKALCAAGLVSRSSAGAGRTATYRLTEAGVALGPVVHAIASWGQEWIDVEPSIEDIDSDRLMWDIRRHVRRLPILPARFVVRFNFPDAIAGKRLHWLVFTRDEVDLCYVDPGFDVDVHIETQLKTMTRIWVGAESLPSALACGKVYIDGPASLTSKAADWLGFGDLGKIQKRPAELRVERSIARAS